MKLVIVAVLAVVAVAVAQQQQQPIDIVRSDIEQQPNGGYNYVLETANGIKQQEQGEVKTVQNEENKPVDVVVVRGSYSYPDKDGQQHSVTYTADEFGFHAESADIPQPPAPARR